ncbi:MAG TPA: glycosyltransferase [bacterium]|nr:glycosyltransferase [bacterium]
MRLIYLSNARLPSEKGNTVQSMHQCEALGRRTLLEFWYPFRHNPMSAVDLFAFYGVEPTFTLRQLPSVDLPALRRLWPRLAFLLQSLSFSAACALRVLHERGVVYTRNAFDVGFVPLLLAIRPHLCVIFEDHDGFLRRPTAFRRFLVRALDGIVVTTSAHAQLYLSAGVSGERLLVAPNGVKPERFQVPPRPSLAPGRRSLVYVGNLFPWKGVYVLAEAVRYLPPDYALTVVGGSPEAAAPFRAFLAAQGLNGRVSVIDYIPPPEVASQLARADILVLPNSARHLLSSTFTSPLKLFEYMAAGRPIVATDIPAVRGILTHERNAILVRPDDAQALAAGIRRIGEDPSFGARLAEQAARDVAPYTWQARANKVIGFVGARLGNRSRGAVMSAGRLAEAAPLSARERWLIRRVAGRLILDIGFAGQKRQLPAYHGVLRRRDGRLVGVDISERAVTERAQPDTLVADASALPFRTGSVDCVILGELLEHHLDVAPFLAEGQRVLRDGGTLLVTTPNPYALSRFVKRWVLRPRAALGTPANTASALGHEDHRVFWDPLTLCHLLSQTGAIVEEVTTLGTWLPWLGRIFPALRRGAAIDVWPLNRFGHITCIRCSKRSGPRPGR